MSDQAPRQTLLLDLSRLISRAARAAPTGIDRVELAYAQWCLDVAPSQTRFAAVNALGVFGPLPRPASIRFIHAVDKRWREGGDGGEVVAQALGLSVYALAGEAALYASLRRLGGRVSYLLVSHHHLDRPGSIRRLRQFSGARFVCFVHDLIPMQMPEYARRGQAARHGRRIDTVARLSDHIIVNSQCTHDALQPYLIAADRAPPVTIAPLGVEPTVRPCRPAPSCEAYFVTLGTLEPRKNHLLLFNLWRDLVDRMGKTNVPRLIVIGQTGWNTRAIFDMLHGSPSLQSVVEHHESLPDTDVQRLMSGARALLFPSFAEGYGLPIAEALAQGIPTLCSDLPSLRAIGSDVPDYLDPLDGVGWREAILAYADPDHPRRQAQLQRIGRWRPPGWADHFRLAAEAIGAQDLAA